MSYSVEIEGLVSLKHKLMAENERLLADLLRAELTVRAWHKAALQMRDMSITGKSDDIERFYIDTAMSLTFYGGGDDPTPSQRKQRGPEQKATRTEDDHV